MRPRVALLCAVLLVTGIAAFTVPYCQYEVDIDINSARLRTRRYCYCLLVDERTDETGLSRVVREFGLGREPPVWGKVSSVRKSLLGVTMYSTRYGPALGCCEALAARLRYGQYSVSQQRRAVSVFLELLRQGKVDEIAKHEAEEYSPLLRPREN